MFCFSSRLVVSSLRPPSALIGELAAPLVLKTARLEIEIKYLLADLASPIGLDIVGVAFFDILARDSVKAPPLCQQPAGWHVRASRPTKVSTSKNRGHRNETKRRKGARPLEAKRAKVQANASCGP